MIAVYWPASFGIHDKPTLSDLIRVSDYHYHVHSQTTNRDYDVIKVGDNWTCTCPDHKFRKVCCKHIHAIEFSLKIREEVRQRNKVTIEPVNIDSCRFCHGRNIVKNGIRKNKHYAVQRFSCSDCHKTFSMNLGFEKMKHNPKGITTAMQLYFSGESLRNVAKSLNLLGMDVTHQTVYNWINKYTKLMNQYLNKIEPKVFITDGLGSYHEAYKKEFWTQKRLNRTLHIRHIHLQGDMNNNKMERLNGEFRDREKVVRGIKKEDSVMFDGYQIFHNYLRPHMGLGGKTPAQACGIEIEGDNKWKTLIQNASRR